MRGDEYADQHRNQHDDDPCALDGLRHRDDDEYHGRGQRPRPLTNALVRQPGSRSLRQWMTMPPCERVNEMNTPIM
jgi:hypothetical protein